MQKIFDVEMEKVTSLTLKCSTNILGRSEITGPIPDLKDCHSEQPERRKSSPMNLNHNPTQEQHETNWDNNGKENYIPNANPLTNPTKLEGNKLSSLQAGQLLPSSSTQTISQNVAIMEHSTENLNKVTERAGFQGGR